MGSDSLENPADNALVPKAWQLGEMELETSGGSETLLPLPLAHCMGQPSSPQLVTLRNGLFW